MFVTIGFHSRENNIIEVYGYRQLFGATWGWVIDDKILCF